MIWLQAGKKENICQSLGRDAFFKTERMLWKMLHSIIIIYLFGATELFTKAAFHDLRLAPRQGRNVRQQQDGCGLDLGKKEDG